MFVFKNIKLEITDQFLKVTIAHDFLETIYFKQEQKRQFIRFFTTLVETALLHPNSFKNYYLVMKDMLSD
ncbi:hypothetical protein ACWN8V_11220 [Vagococcus elongatus]|uniref:Uncharacterized protein n=1 Tax=Vagococcus elongatus TaxID=180344 RepID=A0A430AND6_9ENTE|nr:hypothetical protein [Vagococcus elongatus]RSU09437.1 hypothetical protein CBF29_11335 [Vagococcus elongatus]